MTVCCVLRSGGDFNESWVYALNAGVRQHLNSPFHFACLSNIDAFGGMNQPLTYDWPGWFSKMHLFEPGRFGGLVLYMDLDTLPVGDLSCFATYEGEFAMINDFYRGRERAQSGVMLFRPSDTTNAIWEQWIADPRGHMHRYRGDGEWLDAHTDPDRLQDLYPGKIHSLKVDAKDGPPEGCSLVCAHGRPRFTDPRAGWAHSLWTERAKAAIA